MAGETTDQEPSYIVVNGDEEWLVNYGLMEEELTWEDEDLNTATTNNSSMANEETSYSSTDPAIVTADTVYGPNSVVHYL